MQVFLYYVIEMYCNNTEYNLPVILALVYEVNESPGNVCCNGYLYLALVVLFRLSRVLCKSWSP